MSPDPLSPQAMMQHAAFVRALARSLLRDEHAADDAVCLRGGAYCPSCRRAWSQMQGPSG